MDKRHGQARPSTATRRLSLTIAIVLLQLFAAIFFVIDSIDEVMIHLRSGLGIDVISELLVAFALLAGVVIGAQHSRQLISEARRRDQALAAARGALGEVMALKFAEWRLSPGEAEIALFAIKGCSVAEIADMRQAATGTVRSQLSQIYAKAGVSSQSMLISTFVEELL